MQAPKKIAVAEATGRVGHHIVEVLEARGHDVVPMSRSQGVDVITGTGPAAALADVECVIDAATGPSPDQDAATEFFTTAARNLHDAGQRAGVQRMVVVSIIGTDPFTAGYGAAKLAHERAMLSGARSPRVCCAPRSSTSSSRSSSNGARKAKSATCPRCVHSSSQPGPSPKHSPTWPPNPDRPRHRSRRSLARARRTSSRWRRCSPPGADTP
jgi:NAD(P)H-binding